MSHFKCKQPLCSFLSSQIVKSAGCYRLVVLTLTRRTNLPGEKKPHTHTQHRHICSPRQRGMLRPAHRWIQTTTPPKNGTAKQRIKNTPVTSLRPLWTHRFTMRVTSLTPSPVHIFLLDGHSTHCLVLLPHSKLEPFEIVWKVRDAPHHTTRTHTNVHT